MRSLTAATASITVHKFGGAALADAESIRRVVDLLSRATSGRRLVVVSALARITDGLLAVAARAAAGELREAIADARTLHDRHRRVTEELLEGPTLETAANRTDHSFADLDALLTRIEEEGRLTPAASDAVVARGERLAARLVADALATSGVPARAVDATEVVQTDGRFGDAAPDLPRTEAAARAVLLPLLERGETV